MKTLLLYYSLAGTNRKVAEIVGKAIKADLREIQVPDSPITKASIILRSMLGRGAKISSKMDLDVSNYDKILVQTPMYCFHVAPPTKTCLSKIDFSKKKVAVLFVCGGTLRSGPKTLKKIIEKQGGVFTGYDMVACPEFSEEKAKEAVEKAKKLIKS